jgi:hypothetical protein
MHAQGLFRDEDFQLIEIAQQILFELSDKACATLPMEIERGHNDHLIQIDSRFSLPDSPEREVALLRRQAAEPSHQPSFDRVEYCVGDGTARVIAERQIQVVPPGGPGHRFGLHDIRRVEELP